MRPLLLMEPIVDYNGGHDSKGKRRRIKKEKEQDKDIIVVEDERESGLLQDAASRPSQSEPSMPVGPGPSSGTAIQDSPVTLAIDLASPTKLDLKRQAAHHSESGHRRNAKKSRNAKPESTLNTIPLLTDARTECLLAAARKMGRVRAGIVAGIVRDREQKEKQENEELEKLREQLRERDAATTTAAIGGMPVPTPSSINGGVSPYGMVSMVPRGLVTPPPNHHRLAHPLPPPSPTPARIVPAHYHPSMHPGMQVSSHPHTPLLYLNSPLVPVAVPASSPGPHSAANTNMSPGLPMFVPFPGAWHIPSTPTSTRRDTGGAGQEPSSALGSGVVSRQERGQDRASVQGTPIDSLLSAARTLMVDEAYDEDSDASETTRTLRERKRKAILKTQGGSPVPKRRRVGEHISGSGKRSAVSGDKTNINKHILVTHKHHSAQSPKIRTSPARRIGRRKTEEDVAPSRSQKYIHSDSLETSLDETTPRRTRSALDVLADQAAQEQERRPSVGPSSRRASLEPEVSKGKGRRRKAGDRGRHRHSITSPLSSSSLSAYSAQLRYSSSSPSMSPELIPSPSRPQDAASLYRHPSAPPAPTTAFPALLQTSVQAHSASAEMRSEVTTRLTTPPLRPRRGSRAATEEPSPRTKVRFHQSLVYVPRSKFEVTMEGPSGEGSEGHAHVVSEMSRPRSPSRDSGKDAEGEDDDEYACEFVCLPALCMFKSQYSFRTQTKVPPRHLLYLSHMFADDTDACEDNIF